MTDYLREDGKTTEYPKWIEHPTQIEGKTAEGKDIKKRVLVANPEEEKKLLGGGKNSVKTKDDVQPDKRSDETQNSLNNAPGWGNPGTLPTNPPANK